MNDSHKDRLHRASPKLRPHRLAALYILLLIVVLGGMALLHRCGARPWLADSADIPAPSAPDTIDAAVIYGPSSYRLEGDSLCGNNYEALLALQAATGRPVRMHPVSDIGRALEALRMGRYDLLASLPLDEALRQDWGVSDSVYTDRLIVVGRPGGTPDSLRNALDLDGDTVHVIAGSAAERRMRHLMDENGTRVALRPEEAMTEEYMALKVASGEWDFAVVSQQVYEGMQADSATPPLRPMPVSLTQRHVWVTRPADTTTLRLINHFLQNR